MIILKNSKYYTKENKLGKTSEMTDGFYFILSITGLNKLNVWEDNDDEKGFSLTHWCT